MSDEFSSVLVDPYALAPERIKYPDGHICDICLEQVALMTAAATELGGTFTAGPSTRAGYIGVYVPTFKPDPALLLDLFSSLKICMWNWRRTHEMDKSANVTTDPRA